MNNVTIIGNLTRDPEKRTTQSGISQTTFTVAAQRRFKNADGGHDADFIRCVAWRHTADYIALYGAKGRKIAVNGELQTRSYEKDGQTHTITEIIVNSAEFMQAPSADGQQRQEPEQAQDFTETDDDELPFK